MSLGLSRSRDDCLPASYTGQFWLVITGQSLQYKAIIKKRKDFEGKEDEENIRNKSK
jgi:hypothetical protein